MIDFKLSFDNKEYYVKPTKHLDDYKTKNLKRNDFFNSYNLELIIKEALSKGLTSFRNKGLIVLSFRDVNNVFYGLLVELDELNYITIVTIYREFNKEFHNPFPKINNRINLFNLTQVNIFNNSEKNLDDFYENTYGISTGIKKVVNKKPIIVKKSKPIAKTIDDFQLTEEEKRYFLKNSKNIQRINNG